MFAAPAVVVTALDPEQGLPLALGVLSCIGVALPPQRRRRVTLVFIGTLAGLAMFVGSVLAVLPPVLTLIAVFGVCVGVTVTSPLTRFGPFLLVLGLPLMGAGLSEESPAAGAGAAVLMTLSAAYCWLMSLLWPEGPPPPAHPPKAAAPRSVLLDYGIRLGLAAVIAASLGFSLGWDHPGWAVTAALVVGRPDPALTYHRAGGRAASVALGAFAALALRAAEPTDLALGLAVGLALSLGRGVSRSWWYILPGFNTFVVLTMLMAEQPEQTLWFFAERVIATLFGVGVAYVLLYAIPVRRARVQDEPEEELDVT